jgi:hypothetical protein
MPPYKKEHDVDTRAAVFYDNMHGALSLGFLGANAYIKIAPVIEEQRGQRAKPGVQQFAYPKSIMMTFNQTELAAINDMIGDVIADKIPMLEFSHKSGNHIAKMLIGMGLDGASDNLQICITKHERDYPDADPINEAWFEFATTVALSNDEKKAGKAYQCQVTVFKYWVIEALRISFRSGMHAALMEPVFFNAPDADNERPSRPANNRDNDRTDRPTRTPRRDEDEDERPAPRKTGGGVAKARPAKKSASRDDDDDDSDMGEDQIPF